MSLLPLKKNDAKGFHHYKIFFDFIGWRKFTILTEDRSEKNATFDPIFNNKTLLICKTCVNKTFVKLNCASYGLKNILYY